MLSDQPSSPPPESPEPTELTAPNLDPLTPTPSELQPPVLGNPAPVQNHGALVSVLLGLVMLLTGIIIGYLSHPALVGYISPSATPAPTETLAPSPVPTVDTARATQAVELMAYIVANTRHFRGNPDAAVTLIEFSDFQ